MPKLEKNKKIFIIITSIFFIFILSIIFFTQFYKNNYKTINIGNTNTNKTLEEVKDYILNINSYKATLEVTIKSNKNTNKYILTQIHNKDTDIQEIIKPDNIKGVRLTYKNQTLKIENTNLNLEKIYNNYPYIESNNLWLNSFIEQYKIADNPNISIQDETIFMSFEVKNDPIIKHKELYLDKKTLKPTKLLIQDNNKNEIIYILYNEIEVNY